MIIIIIIIIITVMCSYVPEYLSKNRHLSRNYSKNPIVLNFSYPFRTAYLPRHNYLPVTRVFIDKPHYVARRYINSYFIIDVLAALPLPQFAVLVIIPNLSGPSSFQTENLLKFIIFSQYVPRVIQSFLFYQKVTQTSTFLTEKAWAGAAFNFFLYVLASHVVGALWYLFAIESELRCWNIECEKHGCHSKYLYCGEDRMGDYGFLNTSCPLLERNEFKDSTSFDFGIFLDALHTRVLETTDFRQKILYCSWWGLQSLSSLGQGLKASTFYGEILFADFIAVIGLVLFALLIGNMQKYLQSISNMKKKRREAEEMKEKRREAEDFMSHISLPETLRQRVRRDKKYKWKTSRGVELDSFVKELDPDLRRDIKRHLCLSLLMRVPMFEQMDDYLLGAMCERLKPVLYTQNSYLTREGDPVPEMVFITRGELFSITTDGGQSGFINSANLKAGDFYGEELLTWALNPISQPIPFSTRTVKAVTDVEAFALVADELLVIASQFRGRYSRRLIPIYRYHSQQWRTWAARFIQSAWCRHRIRKLEKALEEEECRIQNALATAKETSTLSMGASIYVSRFSSNVLRIVRRNQTYNTQVSTPKLEIMLPKPGQPEFDDEDNCYN